jgi:hypothetical protein
MSVASSAGIEWIDRRANEASDRVGTGTRTKRIESATTERNPGSFAVCAGSREDRVEVGEDDPLMLDVFMM